MVESFEAENIELVQSRGMDSSDQTTERAFGDDDIGMKSTLRLPPKFLPPRSQRNFSLSIVIPSLSTIFALVSLSVFLSKLHLLLPDKTSYGDNNDISCDLTVGNVSAAEKAFTIDLRSQLKLSFATAKFIDVVWDLVIGQGGRLLLAWISYSVFMDGLARMMETSAVSYQLYASMVFETSSLFSTWYSLRAVSTGHGWRGRAFLTWFGFATMYVLGSPTLMSAATGYLNPSRIIYRTEDNRYIPADSDSLRHCFQFANAHLVGLQDGDIAQGRLLYIGGRAPNSRSKLDTVFYDMLSDYAYIDIYPNPRKIINSTSYLSDYGYSEQDVYNYIKTNVSSTIPSNLSGSPLPLRRYDGDNSNRPEFKDYTLIQQSYCFENLTLSRNFNPEQICLANDYFVWGFSSLLLYIILSLQFVWTLGMYIVWLDANCNSELCRKRRKMRGSFRNALDLAEAIREVLGDELCAYPERQIADQLHKSKGGLRFYSGANSIDNDNTDASVSHIGLSSLKGGGGPRLRLHDNTLYGGGREKRKGKGKGKRREPLMSKDQ